MESLHKLADHNLKAPATCDLRGISNGDLRIHLQLNAGGRAIVKHSIQHGRARCISGCLRHSASMIPERGKRPGSRAGLACGMDSGGWFILDELLDKANRHIFVHHRHTRTAMTVDELASLASDGTEDITKIRWQFSVLLKKVGNGPSDTWWQRIVRVYGVRAVVGHTAARFIEDDRLFLRVENVEDEVFSCFAHNTQITKLESVIKDGSAPGGDAMTNAVHSQLFAFHMHDDRVQESSRASALDATILSNATLTKAVTVGWRQRCVGDPQAHPGSLY